MNIVTSVCVDVDEEGKSNHYPALKGIDDKRIVYWRCCITFCMTSIKFNPNESHLVYTNDKNMEDLAIHGHGVIDMFLKLGIELVYLPFEKFDPKECSKRFRNAFYKHEVICDLANLDEPSILLDSDCIWTKSGEDIFKKIDNDKCLLLQDTYQRGSRPKIKSPHNLSMEDMGKLYDRIPVMKSQAEYPVWYGGELIGGSASHLKIVSDSMYEVFNYCMDQERTKKNSMTFDNGDSVFDNDEYISSYVYNSLIGISIHDTRRSFTKRIWTLPDIFNFRRKDLNLAIWHLPGEKESGLRELFHELIDPKSIFWESTEPSAKFLGKFFNIPRHKSVVVAVFFQALEKWRNLSKRVATQ
ncbi:hypothetical protein MLD52_11490 [Puniceicoccaceae bacterium K14]|nr:hypothetical protein [Puniceicoccaceae bacterium K14]